MNSQMHVFYQFACVRELKSGYERLVLYYSMCISSENTFLF